MFCACISETCSCPENLTIVAGPSSLDDEHRSLSAVIESLVTDVCGECYAFGRTNLIYTTASQGDVDINFPVVLSHDYSSIGSKFVTVIQVPGLALVRRKTEPEEGAYDKVITSSVFSSWPIFAISGLLTLLAGLVIWVLVRIFFCFSTLLNRCTSNLSHPLYNLYKTE